jgi:hypothetical protein
MPKAKELTVKEAIAKLSLEDRAELISHTKDAVFHLASCWDSLRAVENLLDGPEIDTEHISGITGDVDCDPGTAYRFDDALIIETLEAINADA